MTSQLRATSYKYKHKWLKLIQVYRSNIDKLEDKHDDLNPDECIDLLQFGSRIEIFSAVRHKIAACSRKWMKEFIRQGGLGYLLDALEDLTDKRRSYDLSETCEILQCASCVKTVVNSKHGLEALVERKESVQKLAKGLRALI